MREATFNALTSLDAIRDATVLDLFAGSGALGIEALSRGAAHATFVDNDPRAVAVIRGNLESTGLDAQATVVRADGRRHVTATGAVDLALLDPPYAFDDEAWAELLEALDARIAVVESDRDVPIPESWRVLRSKRYGGTVVTIAERA